MKNLNYLKKLVMETIDEDVRSASRKKSRLSESRKQRMHKRKLAEGLRKAKLILEADEVPAEVEGGSEESKSTSIDSLTTDTDINKVDAKALATAIYGGAGAETLVQAMKDVTKGKSKHWAPGALEANGVTDVASMKAAAEKIWPSQEELAKRITDLSTAVNNAQGFSKPEMPAFEKDDFDAIMDALNDDDGGQLAVDLQSGYKGDTEDVKAYHKSKEAAAAPATDTEAPASLDDADKKIDESVNVSRWGKLAGLLTEINKDSRFPFSGAEEVMPGAKNRGDDKNSKYDHSTASGLAKTFLEKGAGTGDSVKMEKDAGMKNSELKPTQTNVKAAKSLMFAFINAGLDFEGAYADNQGYILDGHHRWSGQYLRTAGAAPHTGLNIIHRPDGQDVKTFLTMLTSVGQALGRPTKDS